MIQAAQVDPLGAHPLGYERRRIKANQAIYRQGDSFANLYSVRYGTLKSTINNAEGREHVSCFHMAGELLGLDGLADGLHATSALALEDSEVCSISYAQLVNSAEKHPQLQYTLGKHLSRELVRLHQALMLVSGSAAEERLAAFLLQLSRRFTARGYSPRDFALRMTRSDIGSHLGMSVETVSRFFSAFHQRRLLEVNRRNIRITDVEGLTRASGMATN